MIRATTIASAAALALAAAAFAGSTLTGSYTATISGAPVARFNGVWTLGFGSGGAYTVAENKQVLIRGRVSLNGSTITFKDKSGPAACHGSQATGSYTWKLRGRTLRLTPLRDTCTGRKFVLSRRFARSG